MPSCAKSGFAESWSGRFLDWNLLAHCRGAVAVDRLPKLTRDVWNWAWMPVAEVTAENVQVTADSALDWADVNRVQQGDSAAYRAVVERHQRSVTRLMSRFTRDPAVVEELVQTVFIEAWRQIHNFRGEAPLLHWLTVIGTRTGYRFWKQQAKQRQRHARLEALPEPVAREDNSEAAHDAATKVHMVLSTLPPRDRLVLTLLHLEERSLKEISALTGWSLAMVKVQAFRARRKLAQVLERAQS